MRKSARVIMKIGKMKENKREFKLESEGENMEAKEKENKVKKTKTKK